MSEIIVQDLSIVACVALLNEKGGVGKTTTCNQAIVAVSPYPIHSIVEIDKDVDTAQVFEESEALRDKMITAQPEQAKELISRALYRAGNEPGLVLVNGNPDEVLPAVGANFERNEVLVIIPFLSARAQINNVETTYHKVKKAGYTNILFLGVANEYNKFKFFFGSKEYGLKGVKKELQQQPFVAIPETDLYDFTSMYGQCLLDFANMAKSISARDMRAFAREKSEQYSEEDREDVFTRLMGKFNIGQDSQKFIEEDLAEFKNMLLKMIPKQ